MDHLIAAKAHMSLENILNREREEENYKFVNEEALGEPVLDNSSLVDREVVTKAETWKAPSVSVPSRSELLKALLIVEHKTLNRNTLCRSENQILSTNQRTLCSEHVRSQRHSTLYEFTWGKFFAQEMPLVLK